jgi:competence protein ComFC
MENLKMEMSLKMMKATPSSFWKGVEALVPVPMSRERERERGYNSAVLLAQEISLLTKIPLKTALRKIRPTPPQVSLSREERRRNPRGAYQMEKEENLSKVVLVDDVLTTGSTLEECARVLKKGEVQWVGAVVFGRTLRY